MSPDSDPPPPRQPGLARALRGGRALDAVSTREEFEVALRRLGHTGLSELDAGRAFEAFREVAATKPHVTIRDLEALMDDRLRAIAEQYQLLRMETRTRTGERAWARVEVLERNVEIPVEAEGTGDGPIDAALNACVDALGVPARLVAFSVEALSTGADALAEAHVTVEVAGRHHHAEGVAPSLTEAGVRAFLHALSAARRAERPT
jgi:2-isopropylmalate synthase